MIAVWILSAWLMADFIAGVFHWFEDRILLEETGIAWLETIRTDNGDHHRAPGAMLRFSKWENMKMSAFVTWPIALALIVFGCHWWALVFIFGSFANLVHRYAHMHSKLVPIPIRLLQRTGLFISVEQHKAHHWSGRLEVIPKDKTTEGYCVMSSWLNPILDGLGFWSLLNKICRVSLRESDLS